MKCPYCDEPIDDAAEHCSQCGRSRLIAGRYLIQKLLGKGGMGMVYMAHDRELAETVAVKILLPEVAGSEDAARRLRQETKLARKVRHRNVCGIHEYGSDGRRPYIVMELVDGVNLKEVLGQAGALPPARALEIATQVAEGLQAIHDAGIVHRDLKTPNIMVDREGRVRVLDFGIARSATENSSLTAAGMMVGTPAYMSPEQAQHGSVDARSDIYALGIILYEMLCGDIPFRAETPVAVLYKQVNEPPPLLSGRAAALPRSIRSILGKALAKRREDRYRSAQEMLEALRAAHDDAMIRAAPASGLADCPPTGLSSQGRGAAPVGPPTMPRRSSPTDAPSRVRTILAIKGLVLGVAGAMAVALVGVAVLGTLWLLRPELATPGVQVTSSLRPGSTVTAVEGPAQVEWLSPSPPVAPAATLPSQPPDRTVRAVRARSGAEPMTSARAGRARTMLRTETRTVTRARPSLSPAATIDAASTPSPPLSAAADKGALRLRIRPYAQVFVDGIEQGTTPTVHIVELAAGNHVVRLVHPNYPPLERSVTVIAGECGALTVNLAEEAGSATATGKE